MEDIRDSIEEMKQRIESQFETRLQEFCQSAGKRYVRKSEPGRLILEQDYSEFLKLQELKTVKQEQKSSAIERFKATRRFLFEQSIPPRYSSADISQLKMSEQTNKILAGASALIVGANGFGKTHFAWAIGKEWNKRGETVSIVKAQVLLYDIKTQDHPYKYIDENFGRQTEHLIIDEIDKIFESKADHIYLNYLIDCRYESMLQTIVLGNGTIEQLREAVGNSIIDRLTKEGGLGISCNQSKRDWRLEELGGLDFGNI